MCYAFAKHEIAYWKHVSHWNGKAMENEKKTKFSWILISFTWGQLDNFEKYSENENFPFSKFTVFTIFFFSKT